MGLLDFFKRDTAPVDKGALQQELYDIAAKGEAGRLKKLIRRGADVHGDNNRAVKDAYAAQKYHMVTALLDKGADATALPGNALKDAISNGREGLAAALVNSGIALDTSNSADNSLMVALGHYSTDIFKWVLKQPGMDIHFGDEKLLDSAFAQQKWSHISILLDNGADPHKVTSADPMQLAVKNGSVWLAKKLHEQGITLTAGTGADNSLNVALGHYNTDIFKWVMAQPGMDIHYGDEKLLDNAFAQQKWSHISILLDNDADPHKITSVDPMQVAVKNGSVWLAKKLKERGIALDNSGTENNSLNVALGHYNTDIFKWVMAQPGMDIHFGDEKLLDNAFAQQKWGHISVLLDNGADPHKVTSADTMQVAVRNGSTWLAKKLKERGIALDTSDSESNSLLVALEHHSSEIFDWVAKQPEMDIQFGGGKPLARAFEKSRWSAVRTLLNMGADPKLLPFDPLRKAIESNHQNLAKELKNEAGFKLNTSDSEDNSILVALRQNSSEMTQWVIKQPEMDIHFGNEAPLRRAFEKNRWSIVNTLLDKGAKPAALPFDPMLSAARNNALNVMKKLLKAGVTLNRVSNGETPLIAATDKGSTDNVVWLLKNGADASALNSAALVRAIEKNRKKIAIALLENGADGTPILGMELEEDIRKLAEASALKASAKQTAQMHRIKRTRKRRPAP